MTSSGGVPSSSVMIENWCTSAGGKNAVKQEIFSLKAGHLETLTVFAWEQWLTLQHLGKYTPGTPNINRDVVLLPREHDLWCAIVPC